MKKNILLLGFLIILFFGCSSPNEDSPPTQDLIIALPEAPTNLLGTIVSDNMINLSWKDNSTNETGFVIQRKTDTENYTAVDTVNANVKTFSNAELAPATNYIYRIYSFNAEGKSVNYSNEFSITTSNSIMIGTQTWMKKNLDVSNYRNGDIIPQVQDPEAWNMLTTGAWCYYENNTANGNVYGKIYNWYAVMDPRGLAPIGWHVPSDTEWITLMWYLGGENVAGGKMKATTLWDSPNVEASNSSGFTGLPGGFRQYTGSFFYIRGRSFWWSTSIKQYQSSEALARGLNKNSGEASPHSTLFTSGNYVRCIKD